MKLIDHNSRVSENCLPQLIGRYVVNSFGVKEVVTLKKIQWDYLDWLEARGANIARYIHNCDVENPDRALSEALEWWIYWAYEFREEKGLPRPEWLIKIDKD